ncbi:MAG: sulfatase-like hydrolase/transferase [Candidatus Pseudobacter hemicellulosilyticus]|uniref:Sulfatase-like hydrolase/transferase n=1 Tax=Candidatus Pseudobacter hemicellulosilyticus TaxID=3121375 RepID=A0AAJ5WWD3_9BACT|nr:MAG: sulfatase-like hydrolase/transferase [Pseudobacter sp.]
MIRYFLVLSFSVVGLAVSAQQKQNKRSSRPNVILIYSDDQGAIDLNCYGSKDLYTPNLDGLAQRGVRFTQFYAASPICSPSRASLLTGRYPQRAGLPDMASSDEGVAGMPGSQYTLGELFKDGGYATAHIGKWHVGYTSETMPNQQGFDQSFGFMGGCIDNYSHFFNWSGPSRHDLWRNGKEVYEPGQFFPDLMVREANSFMEQNRNNPFFIYFAINIPHYPLQGEQKWPDYYKDLPSPRDKYAAFVSTMDEKIGLVLKKLDELGLRENTIVIFQPDQGFSMEDRGFGGGGSAGALRGSKFSLFEGGVRVPAIISWPGKIPQSEVRSQFASNIDWFATLAQYCTLQLPARKLDGKSLAPVINSASAPSPHPAFYWQSRGSKENPQWAVRDGDWKLLHNPQQAKPGDLDNQHFMLINLQQDSTESVNLSSRYPDMLQKLKKQYEDWIREVGQQ